MRRERAYFDTSVLVKRYFLEPGSSEARKLFRVYKPVSSQIALIESVSAVQRRRDAGHLRERDFKAILSAIRQDRKTWELIEVTAEVVAKAEELIPQIHIRTLDAIHVASAVLYQNRLGRRLPFVTGDEPQRRAAGGLMGEVIWVG